MSVVASIDPHEAAREPWDAAVVGAGCAGTMAAYQLARQGRRVLLIDKASFPRWKVCGCCLNRRALDALASAGLGGVVRALGGITLGSFRVGARGHEAVIPLPEHQALSREALDTALAEAAVAHGAAFLPGWRASLDPAGPPGTRTLTLRRGDETLRVRTRLVAAADGLGGKLLAPESGFDSPPRDDSRIGAGAVLTGQPDAYAPGIVHMACGSGGYVGMVRLEDGRLDVAAAFDAQFVKDLGGLPDAAARVLAEAGFPPLDRPEGARWRGTPALTRTATRVAAERVFVLGDAAGYVEPFTGEGMAWALSAGIAVAPFAARGIDQWEPVLEQQWAGALRQVVGRRQHLCKLIAAGLRHPGAVRAAVTALTAVPALARPVLHRMNKPATMEQ